jgi:hypothetical protein
MTSGQKESKIWFFFSKCTYPKMVERKMVFYSFFSQVKLGYFRCWKVYNPSPCVTTSSFDGLEIAL